MIIRSFKTLFCERFGCPDSEFQERALKTCLYPHAKCLTPALCLLRSNLFAEDCRFIGDLGNTNGWHEARMELLYFQDANHSGGFLRRALRLRASARKARVLAKSLFAASAVESSQPPRPQEAATIVG